MPPATSAGPAGPVALPPAQRVQSASRSPDHLSLHSARSGWIQQGPAGSSTAQQGLAGPSRVQRDPQGRPPPAAGSAGRVAPLAFVPAREGRSGAKRRDRLQASNLQGLFASLLGSSKSRTSWVSRADRGGKDGDWDPAVAELKSPRRLRRASQLDRGRTGTPVRGRVFLSQRQGRSGRVLGRNGPTRRVWNAARAASAGQLRDPSSRVAKRTTRRAIHASRNAGTRSAQAARATPRHAFRPASLDLERRDDWLGLTLRRRRS